MYVRCKNCKYVSPDKGMSEGKWIAYECINRKGKYYKSLLNVAANGNKLDCINYGCRFGDKEKE